MAALMGAAERAGIWVPDVAGVERRPPWWGLAPAQAGEAG
jgi:hypothetical protein